jgi:predicted NBD/HSP70 family sugar kinase
VNSGALFTFRWSDGRFQFCDYGFWYRLQHRSGSLKGVDSGYMLVVGTGIGGAYVKNGKVETGSHGYAGQASLILMGDIRTQGLSSLFSSRTGMAAFLISAAEQMNRESISGEEFMALVKSGDQKATAMFDQYMNDFTNTLFTLQMLFDPEVFVIGGGISADEY